MTQGAVKTTGKRSRAVSAKKKAILSAVNCAPKVRHQTKN